MNEKEIIRIETYKKLLLLRKQYYGLPHGDFLCDGGEYIWSLQVNIIKKIIERFDIYSYRHLQLINTLFSFFEKICGYLNDSKTKNVPWSIIPSLEDLFTKIKPNTKFVICPLWETNYKIYNRNIIEVIDQTLLSVPNLIFDPSDDFVDIKNKFLSDYPAGIYFVFYPRTERLSVLHFPLLGHEIGHIYSLTWINDNFRRMIEESDIERLLRKEINSDIPAIVQSETLFIDNLIENQLLVIYDMYTNILAETISDIVGTFIFGPSTLFSSYIFAIKGGFDDFKGLKFGYLPWRFRLNYICNALEYLGLEYPPTGLDKSYNWVDEIKKTADIDFDKYKYSRENRYCKYIASLISSNFNSICKSIEGFVGDQNYKNSYDEKLQKNVVERLENGIIPNCIIDDKLKETPIGLRNIVAGTWLHLCELDLADYEKHCLKSLNANLLSLKAIELSHFQNDFNNQIANHDT